jgi:hypothetical protein
MGHPAALQSEGARTPNHPTIPAKEFAGNSEAFADLSRDSCESRILKSKPSWKGEESGANVYPIFRRIQRGFVTSLSESASLL